MDRRRAAVAVILAGLAALLAAKYATQPLGSNFAWWQGMARDVLGGAAPYLDSPDNKPPLWAAVVTAAEATGHMAPVMRVLTALAAAAILTLAYQQAGRWGTLAGLAAAAVATVLLLDASHAANNKPIAAAVALAAVSVRDERLAGVLAGLAGTMAQQFGLILVVVGLVRLQAGSWTLNQGFRAGKWVCVVVGGQYLAVGALFAPATLWAAVDQTILAATSYPAGATAMPDAGVLANAGVGAVAASRAAFVLTFLPVFALAAFGAHRAPEYLAWALACLPILALTVFNAYWVFAIPALAVLAGSGVALTGRILKDQGHPNIRHTFRRLRP